MNRQGSTVDPMKSFVWVVTVADSSIRDLGRLVSGVTDGE